MRREYDFSHAKRGKHAGKRLRIVGDTGSRSGPNTAARIQQIIERDLKSREDFDVVWSELSGPNAKTFVPFGSRKSAPSSQISPRDHHVAPSS
jgi:hypothetical protein